MKNSFQLLAFSFQQMQKRFGLSLKADSWQLKAGQGFTLIEMIVSIALFAVVMTVAVGALLSLTGANKKAQALQSVMNNLNISVDSMVRNVRMGRDYRCVGDTADLTSPGGKTADCLSGEEEIRFTCNPDTPSCADTSGRWGYRFTTGGGCPAGALCKSTDPATSGTWARITAPEVTIEDVKFYVVGTEPGYDTLYSTYVQP